MKIEYEPKHDIMNIEFIEDAEIEESIEVEGVIIDYTKGRKIASIEILDAGKRTSPKPLEAISVTVMREKVKA